jgi:hypothetical protein
MAAKKKPAIQRHPQGVIDDVIIPIVKKGLRKVADTQAKRASIEMSKDSGKAMSSLSKSVKNKQRANNLAIKQMTSYKNKEAKAIAEKELASNGVRKKTNWKKVAQNEVKKKKNIRKQTTLMSVESVFGNYSKLSDIRKAPIKKSNKAAVSSKYRAQGRKELRGK